VEGMGPTWTSKYLKMEPSIKTKICQINDWANITGYNILHVMHA